MRDYVVLGLEKNAAGFLRPLIVRAMPSIFISLNDTSEQYDITDVRFAFL